MNTTTRHHRSLLVVAGLAAGALAVATGPTAAATPGCGSVLTADVELTADVTGCTGPAFVIGAPGVTIDLGGHTISGTGTAPGIDGNGGHDGLTVENGTITGFTIGIELLEADGARVEEVTVTGNQVGIAVGRSAGVRISAVHADGNGFAGVEVGFSARTTVRATSMDGNGFAGFAAIGSDATTVERSTADGNGAVGIRLLHERAATVRRNASRGNEGHGLEIGFDTVGAVVERNEVTGNAGVGILVVEDGNTLRHNVVADNAAD